MVSFLGRQCNDAARKLAVPYLVLDYLLKLNEQTSKLSNLSLHLRKRAPRGFADPYGLRDQSFQLLLLPPKGVNDVDRRFCFTFRLV
jgi:hypothetical protein